MKVGLIAATLVAFVLVGCGGGRNRPKGPAAFKPARGPTLCGRLRARIDGHVDSAAAVELSGLVLSRAQPEVLWTHNDSGDRARIFAIAPNGGLLADVAVSAADAVDWEDIAIGRAPTRGSRDALYIGDIGDNSETRPTVVIYRVPEPRFAGGPPNATAPAERLALRYPDGAHDAEALLVDPSNGALVIVTKSYGGRAGVYVADSPSAAATTTLRRAGRVSLGVGEPVTAGDISADGRTIALRTYDHAFVWSRRGGESLAAALGRRPCSPDADLLVEGQGEALALTGDGRAFYTVPEGARPALRRYAAG